MLIGFIVWALMQSVGEVTTMFPIAGGFVEVRHIRVLTNIDKTNKFPQHAGRFVDPAFSFAMAWMYYFMWSVFLGSGQKYALSRSHITN
jgi:amino acid transporter